MLNHDSNCDNYLLSVTLEILGNRLIGIVATDAYLRQPDYSSRAEGHYYLIISGSGCSEDILAIRYIAREFPEFSFNVIYEDELACYPAHGTWQFRCSKWLFKKNSHTILIPERDMLEEARQAIFAVCHLSRLYSIRKLDLKTHIWGVRQFGWSVRYALNGLFNTDPSRHLDAQDIVDRDWLIDFQNHWGQYKSRLIDSESAFRNAASRLSEIASRQAEALQKSNPGMNVLVNASDHDSLCEDMVPIVNTVNERLVREIGPALLSFYLHGSAARGDMRTGSDIDSFIIVDNVRRDILDIVRKIQSEYPPFSISVYSSAEIIHYPNFRRYALANGTKLVSGDWRLDFRFDVNDDIAGVTNNIYTVRQIARAYLIEGSYGQRAHYMTALMAKLIDHGCLRPVQKWVTGVYPTSRAEVCSFFSDITICVGILSFIDNLESNELALKNALLKGDVAPIERLFYALLEAAELLELHIKDLV